MTSSINQIPERCREAIDYANQIALGEIDASKLVHNGIDRFFDDIKRSEEGGVYHLDFAAAERVMSFVEMMPHIKGPEAGKNLVLAPWQKFIYLNVFGWKDKETGFRRFRSTYTEVPRGNGKSTMVAPAALYMLSADGEGGAEVYSAAVTRDQARIVFNAGRTMALRRAAFLKRAGVTTYQNSVAQDKTASMFQPLSSDARTLDGLNIHLAILDELAQHKTREVYDVIETATGKRNQPLIWMITTAGPDQGGIGYEIHDYAEKVLKGVIKDDTFFTLIYSIDPGDDWTQPEAWRKANPNWGKSVIPDTITQLAQRAMQVPSFQNAFLMKHLNIWTNASVGWLDSTRWSQQALPIDEQEFIGEECMIGLDLANKVDVAAKVKIFRRPNTLDVSSRHPYKYFIIPTLYLPRGTLKDKKNANYEGWVNGGHIVATPGDVIDFGYIEDDILEDTRNFDVKGVPFDPWQATQLAQRMEAKTVPMVEFPATVRNFSEPTKEFEVLVRQGLLFHNNNPAFNWMVSNLVVEPDRKGNIFPRKEREDNKIDGPVAGIMALAQWIFQIQEQEFKSIYDDTSQTTVM